MDRGRFLLTSLAGVLGAPLAVRVQQTENTRRLGWPYALGTPRAATVTIISDD